MSGGLEWRYRRVLRLLPSWYREQWEDDMVAAFLDSWLTGDAYTDECVLEFCKPEWQEIASVVLLAIRLNLGGGGAPSRNVAWGQAVRNAVLTVIMAHAVRGLAALINLAWVRRWVGWLPRPPASMVPASPLGAWALGGYVVDYAWIVVFLTLLLRYYRTARIMASLIVISDLVWLLRHQIGGALTAPAETYAYWVLLDLAPVLAMIAFHRDIRRSALWPWLLALVANYLLVAVPLLALEVTGNAAWVPDFPGLCCFLVSLACVAQAPRAWFRRTISSGVWSLTLTLLAAVAALFRIAGIADYVHDPHLIAVSLAELLIVLAAAALVARDATRAGTGTAAPQPHPRAIII